jgi:hypothetical protein
MKAKTTNSLLNETKKNPTSYTNLYTIFQSNERENSKFKKVRRTERERERERFVAARRHSGALLLSTMSLFGFENPKMCKLAFKRECLQRDNPLPTI